MAKQSNAAPQKRGFFARFVRQEGSRPKNSPPQLCRGASGRVAGFVAAAKLVGGRFGAVRP